MKSLQNVVNETMAWLMVAPVTASAFSQARYKLKHTALIELNQQAVVASRYQEANFRTFWGFRVLAIDGSKLHLPDTDAVRDAFGTIAYSNGKDPQIQGEHPDAWASVLYDVLNRITLDATLGRSDAYEVDLGYWFSLIILQPVDHSIKSSSRVVMELAPLGGIQPAELAKN